MSIEGLAQVSRSTSVNSGRSSYREWRETRCSSTGNTSINPTEEQRPFTPGSSMTSHHNVTHDTFVDSPIIIKNNSKNNQTPSSSLMSNFLSKQKSKINQEDRTSELSYVWDRRSPETITVTPAIVPCRLKQKDHGDQVDGCNPKNDKTTPQPLQSLLNDLVGSQDPLDQALLINSTKAVIHQVSSTSISSSRNSSKRSSESDQAANLPLKRCHSVGSSSIKSSEGKDSDYVPMMNNVNCCATSIEPEQSLWLISYTLPRSSFMMKLIFYLAWLPLMNLFYCRIWWLFSLVRNIICSAFFAFFWFIQSFRMCCIWILRYLWK